MTNLDDREFVRSFEACTLTAERFHHSDHVRLAWLLLRDGPLPQALARFSEGLKRFAASLGKAELYHETITFAYLLLIHERQREDPEGATFEAFAARNPDLLAWPSPALQRYYRPQTLTSDRARRTFVLPDRLLPREAAELEHEPGGADHEGRGQKQVGQGDEQGQEADEAEAESLRAPAPMEA
jgi:hypothetical protein